MQIASHVDICHDDGPAAQHDVWFAFDFGLARDFVSGILSVSISEIVTRKQPIKSSMHGIGYESFHG